ncbi:MAG: M56 family metallopeptidase, partial [Planctomycetota bacterium]
MSETMYAFTMASGMLALGALFLAMVFRCIDIRSPRLSQLLVFAVLIQGMMIVRFPVLLPLLAPPETELVDRDFARGASLSMISETRDSKFDGDQVIGSAIRPATMTTAESTPLDAASFQSSWGDFLFGFVVPGWACGVVLIALLAIARYLRLCWYVANLSNAPENWQTRWDQLCIECKIKSVPMAVSACAGPMLVRRPSGYTFVVPSDFWETLSANQRESVMLHEIAHIRRHDVWRSLFVRSIALMHWFNPAVWWCVCRFEESSEWAADDFLRGRGRHV